MGYCLDATRHSELKPFKEFVRGLTEENAKTFRLSIAPAILWFMLSIICPRSGPVEKNLVLVVALVKCNIAWSELPACYVTSSQRKRHFLTGSLMKVGRTKKWRCLFIRK